MVANPATSQPLRKRLAMDSNALWIAAGMIGVTTAPVVIAAEEAKKSAVEAQIRRSGVVFRARANRMKLLPATWSFALWIASGVIGKVGVNVPSRAAVDEKSESEVLRCKVVMVA